MMEKLDNKKTVYIIDTYNLIFKAFFAFAKKPLITSYKMNVSAIYGFLNMLLKIMTECEPVYIVCAHDTGEKTFRDDIYKEYKANRPECPPDLVPQFNVVFEYIDALSIARASKIGFEADDVMGTIARKANESGLCAKLVSSDRDLFQLINEKTRMLSIAKGASEFMEYDAEALRAEYGITPEQVIYYKALVGDPSDNIPGIRGIGPKAASELISKYKTLDSLYENLPLISGRRRELLEAGRESANVSLELSKIKCDVDIDVDFEKYSKFEPDFEKLSGLCQKYEQKKMMDRVNKYMEKRSDFFYGDTR